MRRQRRGDAGSAFSLFPFLAVLLCTMGAMVVLLVAMAHVSRQKAAREAQAKAAAERVDVTAAERAARARIAEAKAYRDRLGEVRDAAADRLRDQQTRLSNIEDHIRRLRDEVESLQTEARELFALEEEHSDNRRAAEDELARRRELIESLKDEIAHLEEEAANRTRRYAVVPLRDGATGTRRPPIYFECLEDRVVLQPEGVELFREDFLPPTNLSSPLAAAMRSVERYYRNNPDARAANETGAPYALLVVRPGGVAAYRMARVVLDAIDADYGYQPIAAEWPIEYDAPNPELAELATRAVELARQDRVRLASAAPGLFKGRGGLAWDRERRGGAAGAGFGGDADAFGDGGGGGFGAAGSPADADLERTPPDLAASAAAPPTGAPPEGEPGSPLTASAGTVAAGAPPRGKQGGAPTTESAGPQRTMAGAQAASGTQPADGSSVAMAPAGAAPQAAASAPPATPPPFGAQAGGGSAPRLDRGRRGEIPMRRNIQVAVYSDRAVVLADGASVNDAAVAGDAVPLNGIGPMDAKAVVAALRARTQSWGIPGNGFYWKPAVIFHVPEGNQQQAADLAARLRSAGVQVQSANAATANGGGGAGAARRR